MLLIFYKFKRVVSCKAVDVVYGNKNDISIGISDRKDRKKVYYETNFSSFVYTKGSCCVGI